MFSLPSLLLLMAASVLILATIGIFFDLRGAHRTDGTGR